MVKFIEKVACERAGGLPATVRTIALCGTAGNVAYSLLGRSPLLGRSGLRISHHRPMYD